MEMNSNVGGVAMRRDWTLPEIKKLIKLASENYTMIEAGLELKRSRRSIQYQAYKNGIKFSGHKRKTYNPNSRRYYRRISNRNSMRRRRHHD